MPRRLVPGVGRRGALLCRRIGRAARSRDSADCPPRLPPEADTSPKAAVTETDAVAATVDHPVPEVSPETALLEVSVKTALEVSVESAVLEATVKTAVSEVPAHAVMPVERTSVVHGVPVSTVV